MITVILWFFLTIFAIGIAGAAIVGLLAFIARMLEGILDGWLSGLLSVPLFAVLVWGVAMLPVGFAAQCLLGGVAAAYSFAPIVLYLCDGRASLHPPHLRDDSSIESRVKAAEGLKTRSLFWWLAHD